MNGLLASKADAVPAPTEYCVWLPSVNCAARESQAASMTAKPAGSRLTESGRWTPLPRRSTQPGKLQPCLSYQSPPRSRWTAAAQPSVPKVCGAVQRNHRGYDAAWPSFFAGHSAGIARAAIYHQQWNPANEGRSGSEGTASLSPYDAPCAAARCSPCWTRAIARRSGWNAPNHCYTEVEGAVGRLPLLRQELSTRLPGSLRFRDGATKRQGARRPASAASLCPVQST